MLKSSFLGHRKRIKEKYLNAGLKGWADYEILELLLSYAIPRKDTKPVAKALLSRFKTIKEVFDCEIKSLNEIEELSEHSAILLKLFKDIAILYSEQKALKSDVISSPDAAIKYLKNILSGRKDEEFYALFVDASNNLIKSVKIHEGIVNKAVIYPRKVAEIALENKATGVIIAHNHPSGSLDPSNDDIKSTRAVQAALGTIDITLLDHVIISRAGYMSFKEKGYI